MKKVPLDSKDRAQFVSMVNQANEQLMKNAENGMSPILVRLDFPASDPSLCAIQYGDRHSGRIAIFAELEFKKFKIPGKLFGSKIRWQMHADYQVMGKSSSGFVVSKLPVSAWQEALNHMAEMKNGNKVPLMTQQQAKIALATI